jgi:hypothetical protein
MRERIQYLTKKAQHGLITEAERQELAQLLGRNPNDFQNDKGLSQLIGMALVAIAIAIIAELLSSKK